MDDQKNNRSKLEKHKSIFFKAGLSISMVLVLLAFEYKVAERTSIELPPQMEVYVDDEMIDITIPKPPDPLPAPDTQEFTIVPDDALDEDHDFTIDVDLTGDVAIEDFTPVDFRKEEELIDEQEIFINPEIMPEFPGGITALYEYMANNLRYPVAAKEAGIQGRVFVSFVIEKDGSVTNVQVMRGIGGGCDEEAARVIQNLPRWRPGQMGTRPVRVSYSIPVFFKLQK